SKGLQAGATAMAAAGLQNRFDTWHSGGNPFSLPVCFAPGTRVVVPPAGAGPSSPPGLGAGRTKWVGEPVPGGVVLAKDDRTGELAWKPVLRVYRRLADHLRTLTIRGANGATSQELRTTNEHPFWVEGEGWVKAEELRPGSRVLQSDGEP